MNKNVVVVLVVGVVLLGLACMGSYNGLVGADERITSSWAQVENVLQRRYDLIPNLVNAVKGYAQHEKGVLEEITRLRSQWAEAKTPAEKMSTSSQMEGAIGRLMMVTENYPELKANENFRALQDELAGTENRIAVERQRYNESVQGYNVKVRRMPGALLAGFLGFEKKDVYFKAEEKAKTVPKVQF